MMSKKELKGYHNNPIPKGVLGEISKITEEYLEFMDGVEQNNPILQLVELSDLIGAIESYLKKYHSSISLQDVINMKDLTKRAFDNGKRGNLEEENKASYYCIFQYVPNPLNDERINFGAIVFKKKGKEVKSTFLPFWDRVKNFSPDGNIEFLIDFKRRTKEANEKGLLFPGEQYGTGNNVDRMLKLSRAWRNTIQVTEPRGSLTSDLGDLLQDTIDTYL